MLCKLFHKWIVIKKIIAEISENFFTELEAHLLAVQPTITRLI